MHNAIVCRSLDEELLPPLAEMRFVQLAEVGDPPHVPPYPTIDFLRRLDDLNVWAFLLHQVRMGELRQTPSHVACPLASGNSYPFRRGRDRKRVPLDVESEQSSMPPHSSHLPGRPHDPPNHAVGLFVVDEPFGVGVPSYFAAQT